MGKKSITIYILNSLKKNHKALEALEKLGIDAASFGGVHFSESMEDILCMLWDIPEDNTIEKIRTLEDGTQEIDDDCFCRDMWSEAIFEFCEDDATLDSVIDMFANWKKQGES